MSDIEKAIVEVVKREVFTPEGINEWMSDHSEFAIHGWLDDNASDEINTYLRSNCDDSVSDWCHNSAGDYISSWCDDYGYDTIESYCNDHWQDTVDGWLRLQSKTMLTDYLQSNEGKKFIAEVLSEALKKYAE